MTALHSAQAIGIRDADIERVMQIYKREFRSFPIDRALFENLDPRDVGELLVWWDERTELGGWDVRPATYLRGVPWALHYFGGGMLLEPLVVRPGELWIEHVLELYYDPRSGRATNYSCLRPWPTEVFEAFRALGVQWRMDEATSVARFVRIERIDLERCTNRFRDFVIRYVGWWSIIKPNSYGDGAAISEHLKPVGLHRGRTTKPKKGTFQIGHLFAAGRFERLDVDGRGDA